MKLLILLIICFIVLFAKIVESAPTPSPSPYMPYTLKPRIHKGEKARIALLKRKGNYKEQKICVTNKLKERTIVYYSEIGSVQRSTL